MHIGVLRPKLNIDKLGRLFPVPNGNIKIDFCWLADGKVKLITKQSIAHALREYLTVTSLSGNVILEDGYNKAVSEMGHAFEFIIEWELLLYGTGQTVKAIPVDDYALALIKKIEGAYQYENRYEGDYKPDGVVDQYEWDAFVRRYS